MAEVVLIGSSLIGGAIWLQHRPSRAKLWYLIAAWALANGDAAVERATRRKQYMADVEAKSHGR